MRGSSLELVRIGRRGTTGPSRSERRHRSVGCRLSGADRTKGSYFALTGGTDGDTFVLRMSAVRGGVPVELRMVFCDIEPDSFRWVWERSTDAGATWDPAWEIAYTRIA